MITAQTIIAAGDGHDYIVEIHDELRIVFLDVNTYERVATFTVDTFAEVTESLALNLGTARRLDAEDIRVVRNLARI
jgi:hypothetical protein